MKDGPVLSAAEVAAVRAMVIAEDEHVLILDKPAGLSSQGGRGQANTLDELLAAFTKPSGRRPVLVHRLDRDTSGVILCAKSKPAASFLGKAVMARRLEKTYLALVGGGPPEPREGVIALPLRRDEQGREAYTRVCAEDAIGAQAALTRYRTLAASTVGALLEARPETGRMHQIRVHLASGVGRPIAGDVRYGGALTLGGASAPRLMLHAARLRFPHPDGGWAEATASPPPDFAVLAAAAGLRLEPGSSEPHFVRKRDSRRAGAG